MFVIRTNKTYTDNTGVVRNRAYLSDEMPDIDWDFFKFTSKSKNDKKPKVHLVHVASVEEVAEVDLPEEEEVAEVDLPIEEEEKTIEGKIQYDFK